MKSRRLRKYSLNGKAAMHVDVLGCGADCMVPDETCPAAMDTCSPSLDSLSCTPYDAGPCPDFISCKVVDYEISQS